MKNTVPLKSVYPKSSTIPCIVCGKKLENVFQEMKTNQPNEASCLHTEGHYGDTFFDPGTDAKLEVNICNPCMEKAWYEGKVCYYEADDISGDAFVKDVKSSGD
jgi:hypothetical protein